MAYTASFAGESAARAAADAALQALLTAEIDARAVAIEGERQVRAGLDTELNKRLAVVEAMVVVNGGAQTTRLAYLAGAATIADIGSDGTWLTVITTAAHGYSDGDYIAIDGTVAYDGTVGPIDVLAANEFRVATVIPVTAHETVGTVATSALRVESSAEFLAGMWAEAVNNLGQIHVSTVASVATGIIHLTTPVPTSWTGSAVAGVTSQVSITTREVALARTVLNQSPDAGLTLPQVIAMISSGFFHVDAFGADRGGTTSSTAAFTAAWQAAAAVGGGVIAGAGPHATYLLTDNIEVTASNVTFDGAWSVIKGTSNGRFLFNGDSGVAGDRSHVVRNSHVYRWQFGTARTDDQTVKGPRFYWCEDCSGEYLIKISRGSTAFNLDNCRRCAFRHCVADGVVQTKGGFGFLTHMTDDCELEDCHAINGSFVYAFQVKGGRNNTVKDCTVKNVQPAGSSRTVIGFRDRGNAPWKASSSALVNPTYSFADLGWSVADERRASHWTRFINCRVEDSNVTAFAAQEAIGTQFIDCSAKNVKAGLRLNRVRQATEARLAAATSAGTTVLTVIMEIDEDSELPYPLWLNGESVIVTLNDGSTFATTANGNQVGNTLTIVDALPINTDAEAAIGHAAAGSEKGYVVRNFNCDGTTLADGIRIAGATGNQLPDVIIERARLENCKRSGLAARDTVDIQLVHVRALNNNQEVSANAGITVSNSMYPVIEACQAIDDQAVHTQAFGIQIGESNTTMPTVRNCRASGNTTLNFKLWLPGNYADNVPAEATKQTTDATLYDDVWRCQLVAGQTARIEVMAIARKSDGTDQAVLRINGVFTCDGSGVTTQVNSTTVAESVLSAGATSGGWTTSFSVASPVVRFRLRGGAGQTVNWVVRPRVTIIS